MIDYINSYRTEHIMTIEDPIEFLHRDKKSLVNQREVEVDTKSFAYALALRAASGPRRHPRRRDARLRDHRDGAQCRRDRPPRALDAAHGRCDRDDQPRHLGLPAAPAEAGPPAAGGRAQGDHLHAPRPAQGRKSGRVPAVEVLRSTAYIRDCVENKEKTKLIQDGHRRGNVAVRHADVRPVAVTTCTSADLISFEEALRQASNPDEFKLKVAGIQSARTWPTESMEAMLEAAEWARDGSDPATDPSRRSSSRKLSR